MCGLKKYLYVASFLSYFYVFLLILLQQICTHNMQNYPKEMMVSFIFLLYENSNVRRVTGIIFHHINFTT